MVKQIFDLNITMIFLISLANSALAFDAVDLKALKKKIFLLKVNMDHQVEMK